jgi:hypothetical protein
MTSFIQKHLSAFVALLISIVGWVYTATTAMNKAEDSAYHLEQINRNGTEMAQRSAWRIDMLEKDVTKLDVRLNSAVSDIIQIKSDVRVVADWVEDQKRKSRAYESSALSKKEPYKQVN